MDRFGTALSMLDIAIDSDKKRHLAGGILLSISLLFGGLAFTVMTIKMTTENTEVEENNYE